MTTVAPPRVSSPIVAVVGPTAAGKSDLAIALARRFDGEVINADSMQLYRGMDVGTAKLTVAERGGVPHHLLDIWDVTQTASVADYQRLARAAIADISARGRMAILVGGSGLYLRAALDDLEFPGTDAAIRERLESELADIGSVALHERLRAVDPVAADNMDHVNCRRIVRALEVIELTGEKWSARLPDYKYLVEPTLQIGIDVPFDVLDERIALRVDRMWEQGFVDEVRALERAGLRDGVTAVRALGYAPVLQHIDGLCDEATARATTAQTTRRFARRQLSWFRRDPRITWIPFRDEMVVAAARAVELVAGGRSG
ncbi:MAG: tRNA ((37)-N6)-dimethylallyltransferase MiaA [Frankiales bacterium]|nr:tRNA ((37)-N6)-dimethylallyltransferase MiaA [Frankiales bacterium]